MDKSLTDVIARTGATDLVLSALLQALAGEQKVHERLKRTIELFEQRTEKNDINAAMLSHLRGYLEQLEAGGR